VAVPTPQGLIQVQWRRDAEEAQIELELPDPIKAEVRLPGVHEPAVTGSRRWSVPMAALEQAMVVTQEHAR
jgi:hypothetical protein